MDSTGVIYLAFSLVIVLITFSFLPYFGPGIYRIIAIVILLITVVLILMLNWIDFIVFPAVSRMLGITFQPMKDYKIVKSQDAIVKNVGGIYYAIGYLTANLFAYTFKAENPEEDVDSRIAEAPDRWERAVSGIDFPFKFHVLSCGRDVQKLYGVSYVAGLTPGFTAKVNVPFDSDGTGFSFGINSLFPKSTDEILGIAFNALLFMILLNEVQLILLSGSIFFIALFMAIGLIAWVFGISRSFGGAMIAFGLGLGIVFPLLVSVTYGFISTQVLVSLHNPSTISGALTGIFNLASSATGLVAGLFATYISGSFPSYLGTLLLQYGYVIAGLTFVPFLNFTILDAFIVDFSKVMGEKVSFMALIGNLV
jgi:hypothetical protein